MVTSECPAQAPAQMLPNGHKKCSQTRGWGPGLDREQEQDRDRVNRWDYGGFVIQLQVTSYKFHSMICCSGSQWERRGWRLELETAPQSKETIKRSTNTTRQKVIFNETEYNFRQRLSSLKCRRWTQEARNWSLLVIIKHSTYLSACSKHEPHWRWHVPGWDLTAQWENST